MIMMFLNQRSSFLTILCCKTKLSVQKSIKYGRVSKTKDDIIKYVVILCWILRTCSNFPIILKNNGTSNKNLKTQLKAVVET